MKDNHVPRPRPPARARLRPARAAAIALGLMAGACASNEAEQALIDREAFIATYVDLRSAAFEAESRVLSDSARAAVLADRDVTAAGLMAFAEAHGEDVEFMTGVWEEIELRLDARRSNDAPR